MVIPFEPGSFPVNGAVPVYPLGLRNSLTPPSADHCQAVLVCVSEKSRRLWGFFPIGPPTHWDFFSTNSSTAASPAGAAARALPGGAAGSTGRGLRFFAGNRPA